jgi:hypothetical protein
MTQEKDLLLKDLCMRIPYGVKVQVFNHGVESVETLYQIDLDGYISTLECDELKYSYKPYLFPLSSITEERKKELQSLMISDSYGILYHTLESFNYMCKNNIDFRGLIEKGLALEAPEGMYN